MSRLLPGLAYTAPINRPRGQMSQPKRFTRDVPRGRVGTFRPRRVAAIGRDEFLALWSLLMMRKCGTARAVAQQFECTEQTGRNWIDGFSCPTGHAVMRAMAWWPEEFTGAVQGRRAA